MYKSKKYIQKLRICVTVRIGSVRGPARGIHRQIVELTTDPESSIVFNAPPENNQQQVLSHSRALPEGLCGIHSIR